MPVARWDWYRSVHLLNGDSFRREGTLRDVRGRPVPVDTVTSAARVRLAAGAATLAVAAQLAH